MAHIRFERLLKKLHPISIIKTVVILLFLIVTFVGFKQVVEFYSAYSNSQESFDQKTLFDALFRTKFLRPSLLIGIAVVGVLVNKKKGWLLIMSYFYFVLTGAIYTLLASSETNIAETLTFLISALIIASLMVLMNTKRVFINYYKYHGSMRLKLNMIATILGIGIGLLNRYFY